jgi:hypothetical protein
MPYAPEGATGIKKDEKLSLKKYLTSKGSISKYNLVHCGGNVLQIMITVKKIGLARISFLIPILKPFSNSLELKN